MSLKESLLLALLYGLLCFVVVALIFNIFLGVFFGLVITQSCFVVFRDMDENKN